MKTWAENSKFKKKPLKTKRWRQSLKCFR